MLYQLIEISTGNSVQEADVFEPILDTNGVQTNVMEHNQVQELSKFGGPWGNPDLFEWQSASDSRVLEVTKDDKVQEIKQAFLTAVNLGFTCANGIKMDSSLESVSKLESGYNLAVRLSATSMDIRDFDNVTHAGILVTDVDTMITELGTNYQTLWSNKNTKLDSVKLKTKVSTVNSVSF